MYIFDTSEEVCSQIHHYQVLLLGLLQCQYHALMQIYNHHRLPLPSYYPSKCIQHCISYSLTIQVNTYSLSEGISSFHM